MPIFDTTGRISVVISLIVGDARSTSGPESSDATVEVRARIAHGDIVIRRA
jgi:hypothetical protein